MRSSKIQPQPPPSPIHQVAQQILSSFQQVVAATTTTIDLAVDVLTEGFLNDPSSLEILARVVQRLGFTKEEKHAEAKLPPILENFVILKEQEQVAAAIQDLSFKAAQDAVQKTPTDEEVVTKLREETAKVTDVCNTAIQSRLQEEGLGVTCRNVVAAGNADFAKVYDTVWQMIANNDKEGCQEYQKAITHLTVPDKATPQSTTDAAQLYQHAALAQAMYQQFVHDIADQVPGVSVSLPSSLKNMARIVEKTLLKRLDDPGNANRVCDVVRGMIMCDNMGQLAAAIACFQQRQDIVVVTRVKDRFFKEISAGGWRDIMINFYFIIAEEAG